MLPRLTTDLNPFLARVPFNDLVANNLTRADAQLRNALLLRMRAIYPDGFWSLAVHLGQIDETFFNSVRDNQTVKHHYLIQILSSLILAKARLCKSEIENLTTLLASLPEDKQEGLATKMSGIFIVCQRAKIVPANPFEILYTVYTVACIRGYIHCQIPEVLSALCEVGLLFPSVVDKVLTSYRSGSQKLINNVNAIPEIFQFLSRDYHRTYQEILRNLFPRLFTHGREILDALERIYQEEEKGSVFQKSKLKIHDRAQQFYKDATPLIERILAKDDCNAHFDNLIRHLNIYNKDLDNLLVPRPDSKNILAMLKKMDASRSNITSLQTIQTAANAGPSTAPYVGATAATAGATTSAAKTSTTSTLFGAKTHSSQHSAERAQRDIKQFVDRNPDVDDAVLEIFIKRKLLLLEQNPNYEDEINAVYVYLCKHDYDDIILKNLCAQYPFIIDEDEEQDEHDCNIVLNRGRKGGGGALPPSLTFAAQYAGMREMITYALEKNP